MKLINFAGIVCGVLHAVNACMMMMMMRNNHDWAVWSSQRREKT